MTPSAGGAAPGSCERLTGPVVQTPLRARIVKKRARSEPTVERDRERPTDTLPELGKSGEPLGDGAKGCAHVLAHVPHAARKNLP